MDNIHEKKMDKKIRLFLASAAAVIIVVCALVVIFQVINGTRAENNSIAVYRSGGEVIVRIGDKERTVTSMSANSFRCDKEKNRVFFTAQSSRADGIYDLYYIEKQRSEISEPKIIDVGIEEGFDVVSGKIYYLKKNNQILANDGCVCDIDSGRIETFSSNVEKIFALNGSEKLYFTKMHGDNKVLYSYENGTPKELCRDIVNVFSYNKTDRPHIIYEKKSAVNTGTTELYIAYSDSEPEMICDNTCLVMLEDYSAGGNLYYFTSSTESVSWSAVISDEYAESDKSIVRPERNRFLELLGISEKYNEALKNFQDKLVRDEIRAALNESVDKGELSAPVFTAFAYNENGTFKIVENVDPENVYSVSDFGEPKIIFESAEISSGQSDMATLVSIAQRSSVAEVIEYARALVNEGVKSGGTALAAYGANGAVSYELSGYDNKNTLFSFSENGSRIFAFVRDVKGERLNLYTNSINENLMPSSGMNVDTGLSSYRIIDDAVIYLKADSGKNTGDLYSYDGEKSVKLSNDANAFTVENSKNIIIIKEHDLQSSQPTADYYIYNGREEEIIGSDIVVSSFVFTEDNKAAYISGGDDGNSLYIYSEGDAVAIAENVTEILLFK